jgi:hypothetical protein
MFISPLQACICAFGFHDDRPHQGRESQKPEDVFACSRYILNPWGYLLSDLGHITQPSPQPPLDKSSVATTVEKCSETMYKPPVRCSVSHRWNKKLWERISSPIRENGAEVDLVKTLDILLAHKVDPNFLGGCLRPPLTAAAEMCPPGVVLKLTEYGANAKTELGQGSCIYGVFNRNWLRPPIQVLSILLDAGSTFPTDTTPKACYSTSWVSKWVTATAMMASSLGRLF